MGTGACGINCSVCRLHRQGLCSTCGSGTSDEGADKLATQHQLMGGGCPVLQCAVERCVGHCLRDCDDFPCRKLGAASYPFGRRFLDMHARRRAGLDNEKKAAWPATTPHFWRVFTRRPTEQVCIFAPAQYLGAGRFSLQCLHESWHIDRHAQKISKEQGDFGGEWDRQVPFLILIYLAHVHPDALAGVMGNDMELYYGTSPFAGPHEIKNTEFINFFGRDPSSFSEAARRLGGRLLHRAHGAARFFVFPKLPVDLLLWRADEEFPAQLSVLFDRNMPHFYPAAAVAVAVNLLLRRLVLVARG